MRKWKRRAQGVGKGSGDPKSEGLTRNSILAINIPEEKHWIRDLMLAVSYVTMVIRNYT